jgi:hypothetical protein
MSHVIRESFSYNVIARVDNMHMFISLRSMIVANQ